MPQLKPSFISAIHTALGNSRFTVEDFNLDWPESGRTLVKITFVHKPEYCLSLFEEEKREQVTIEQKYLMSSRTEQIRQVVYSVKAVPGRFKTKDDTEIGELGDLLETIPKWCESVRDDLYALMPKLDPLDQLKQQLQAKLDELVNQPNAFFNEEELSVVDKRFDQLYQDISELREQYSLSMQQLEALQKEIGEFKKSARAYPKGMWAKITSNKLVNATGKILVSPEGRTFMFQEIRRALGLDEGS